MNKNLSSAQFTVVTEHVVKTDPSKRRAKKHGPFDTFDEALAHAESLDPNNGGPGNTFPNISQKWESHPGYERGVWDQSGDNKYAVVINSRPSKD